MMKRDHLSLSGFLSVTVVALVCLGPVCWAQQDAPANETVSSQKAPDMGDAAADILKVAEDIKEVIVPATPEAMEIDKRLANTEEVVKKKEEQLQGAQAKAQEVLQEKETLEKEVQVKQEAAQAVKEELEAVKQQAVVKKDPQLVKKVKALTTESEKLDDEVSAHQARLDATASKATVAQRELELTQAKVQQLKDSLENIKKEKTAKKSWAEKGIEASILILMGLVFFVVIKFAVRKFENLVTEKDSLRESEGVLRAKTLGRLFYWLGTIAILLVIVYMVLKVFGFDVAPLLAGAGIIGLAFGFGGQYLIRDVINGFFILIEGQFRINDVVKIGDVAGLVEGLNLRITTLRDLEGRVIVIPNGEIKTVINFTREYSHALFDVGVAYKENVDRVMDVIKDLAREMRQDTYFGRLILDDLEMFGVDDFGDSQVTIKFRIKTLPIKQWEVAREFRRRLKNRFDELGIEIPFPHCTLYMGAGADNEWLRQFAGRMAPKK